MSYTAHDEAPREGALRRRRRPGVSPVGPWPTAISYTRHVPSTARSRRLVALLAGTAAGLAACSGGGAATPTTPPTTAAPTTTQRPVDGRLRLAALLPRSGAAPEIGSSMEAALRLALDEINTKGGVNGQQLTISFVDEGSTPADAAAAVGDLVDQGYDALIGPTSSPSTLEALGIATRAGLLVCSPTATALSLDEYPDDGLFFRTAPSDSLQATALAQLAGETGATGVAVAYVDDAYGAPFAEAVYAKLPSGSRRGLFAFPAGTAIPSPDADAVVRQIVGDAAPADAVVVIGDSTSGPAIIHAIDDAAAAPRAANGESAIQYVVNDAIRRPDPGAQPFGPELAPRIQGASPAAYPPSGSFLQNLVALDPTVSGLFAVNAYDCLTLIALAAIRTESLDPHVLHDALSALTTDGRTCETFFGCEAGAADKSVNLNYDGPGRRLDLGDDGDPTRAAFDRFSFDPESGRDVSQEIIEVRA